MGYSIIERSEARYRVVYGRHNRITPASELPSQYDVLFLEGLKSEFEIGDVLALENDEQYSAVVKDAQEKNAKVYFGDLAPRRLPFQVKIRERRMLPDWPIPAYIRVGEFYAGLAILTSRVMEAIGGEKISRRDLFKKTGEGVLTVWCLSWSSKLGSSLIKEGKEVPRVLEKMISAEDLVHPEDLSLLFRNAVAAKKSITIGKREQAEHNRKAEIALVFGGGHTGLADFLRKGEEACQKIVRLYPRWFLKAMIEEGNLDYISIINGAKFNSRYGVWVVSDRFSDEGLYFSVNREQEYSGARKEVR